MAVLTINRDRRKADITRVLDKVNTSLPVLRDPESTVSNSYRIYAIPTLYLIDQQGKVYTTWIGSVDNLDAELTDNIEFLLERRPAPKVAVAEASAADPGARDSTE